jgi:polyhydroxyalkanoate synthesis regulator phasin
MPQVWYPEHMSNEPDNLILQLLRQMRTEMSDMRSEMATKSDLAELRSEMNSLRADVASDIHILNNRVDVLERNVGDQIAGLRHMVTRYHSSVVGHGHLISDLESRVTRVERHLDLPAVEQH